MFFISCLFRIKIICVFKYLFVFKGRLVIVITVLFIYLSYFVFYCLVLVVGPKVLYFFFRPIFAGSKPKLPGPILPKGHRLDTTQACLLACYPVGNDQTAGGLFLPRAPKASTPTCVPSSPLARPFSCMTSAHGLFPTVFPYMLLQNRLV